MELREQIAEAVNSVAYLEMPLSRDVAQRVLMIPEIAEALALRAAAFEDQAETLAPTSQPERRS